MHFPDLPIVYTRHAKGRMRWRRVSAGEVTETIRTPDRVDGAAFDRAHAWKTLAGRKLRVIVAVEQDRIVVISVMEKS